VGLRQRSLKTLNIETNLYQISMLRLYLRIGEASVIFMRWLYICI